MENFETCFELAKKELKNRLGTEKIHSRTFNNWIAILAAFRAIEVSISVPFAYSELFEICLRLMRQQQMKADESSETTDFWNLLNSLRMTGKVLEGTHFVIKKLRSFEPMAKDKGNKQRFDFGGERKLLFLNWNAIQPIVSSHSVGKEMKLDVSALLNYLRTCDFYLGNKQQRYNILLPNGTPDYSIETKDGKTYKNKKTVRSNAMVFDYHALKDATGIDLETFIVQDSGSDQDIDNDEDDASESLEIKKADDQQELLF